MAEEDPSKLLSAREYAKQAHRPERTVQGWAERKEVAGAQLVGRTWVALRSAWEAAAAKDRRPGRRDRDPRTKKAAESPPAD